MLKTTLGQLLINEALPPDLRNYSRKLDKKGTGQLFQEIAGKYPERYKEIAKAFYDIGRKVSTESGGYSFDINSLGIPAASKQYREQLRQKIERVQTSNLPDSEKQKQIVDLLQHSAPEAEKKLYEETSASKNPLAMQVMSGARGKPGNLRSVMFGDMMYVDNKNRPIPIPVLRSYAEGLSPVEYWAGTFGTRKGISDLKFCLAADTLVLTHEYKTIALSDVTEGMLVMGADKDGFIAPVKVKHVFHNGMKACYRYRFRKGYSATLVDVVATEDHRVLAQIKEDHEVAIAPSLLPLKDAKFNHSAKHNTFIACQSKGEHKCELRTYRKGTLISGLDSLIFHGRLHSDVWSWDDDAIEALIGGIYSDHAILSVKNNEYKVRLRLPIFKLAQDIQRLLELRLGIWTESLKRLPKSANRETEAYEITISTETNIRTFLKRIPLITSFAEQINTALLSYHDPLLHETGFRIQSKEYVGQLLTIDLEVDNADHLYVLANGIIVSNSTQDAGYFAKQLNQATHRLVIAAHDSDKPSETLRGVPMPVDDPDNEGALLAQNIGRYKRNHVLTPKILADLKAKGHDQILIRSPIVGGHPDGGLYSADVGVRERGGLPAPGDNVGMAAGQALCLEENTLIRMADGTTKPIKELRVGDMVLGSDIFGIVRPVTVKNVFNNGLRDCWETIFRLGTGKSKQLLTLTSTLDHKILAVTVKDKKNWKPAAQVTRVARPDGKRFYAKLSLGYDDSVGHVDEPYALILGLLIGDGNYTGCSHTLKYSCYDPLLIADIHNYLFELGLAVHSTTTPGEWTVVALDAHRQYFIDDAIWVRNPLKAYLHTNHLYGQYSGNKTLPDAVYTWNNRSVAAVLAGLLATDGWVSYKHSRSIGYCSTSVKLITAIKYLLQLRFGICSSSIRPSIKRRPDGNGYYAPTYNITINSCEGIQRFRQYIIDIPGIKERKLDILLRKLKLRRSKYMEVGRCTCFSQQFVGPKNTYDIEVDHSDHLFVLANGLITSNSEPITQSQISSKHTGGVAGAGGAISGFKYINQVVQVPKVYTSGATHAKNDGKVGPIYKAPAGGKYMWIGGVRHYIGTGLEPTVKTGDVIEAGDIVSDGLPNPAEIVEHKGIGEGRRYFTNIFRKIYADSGMKAHRRNIELLARGLINHVQLNDELGDYITGDTVPYDMLEHQWKPREGSITVHSKAALNKYLETPVLHYTIGTRITPSVVKQLDHFGIKKLTVHNEPPPFQPVMIRAAENLQHDPDWMTRQLGTNLRKGFLTAAHRGSTSDETGTSYVPPLARSLEFGQIGKTKGYDPKKIIKEELLHPEFEEFEEA